MSLTTPSNIRELQIKLYRKAKNEPEYRFYWLYDKIYREDILAHAYELARANKGAPGVDGQTFEAIESEGLERWLNGIREELRHRTYRPQPVRRVKIPKPGGGERPLGIPIDALHYTSLGFIHGVSGRRLIGFADITIAIRSAAQHADLARVRPVSLTAARPLQDLCPLIFGNHPLELHQQLIFRTVALRRFYKQRLDSVAGQFLDQQNLIRILPAEAVRGVGEHNLYLSFGGQVSHALQPGRSNVAPL